jgi:beta-glucosidase-like glycosyl hydrolase/CubicO group peptidase (beta-lactamase class C family)
LAFYLCPIFLHTLVRFWFSLRPCWAVWLFGCLALLGLQPGYSQPGKDAWKWADSVYHALPPRARIGQFFMVAAYSNKGKEHQTEIETLIREFGIGGVIFFQGGPGRQARLSNQYQSLSQVPLLVGMDAEWGLAMRLDSTLKYPRQMTLGALDDKEKIREMGRQIARQCRRLGMQVSFSPVADIQSNASNPVIGSRSFGQDRDEVYLRASAYAKGLRDGGVLAVAKHFPGHGDTDKDSHFELPTISQKEYHLQEHELYPFRKLVEDSLEGMMVGHLQVPALDPTPGTPASLSRKIIQSLLKDEMEFKGLVFSDALNMKAVSKNTVPGEVEVKALLAGNDVLLFPENVSQGVKAIEQAISRRLIRWREIERRVKKILAWKYYLGLHRKPMVRLDSLAQDLNRREDQIFLHRLFGDAITIVRNRKQVLPFRNLDSTRFASLLVGPEGPGNAFQQGLSRYAPFRHFQVSESATEERFREVVAGIDEETVVIALTKLNGLAGSNYGARPYLGPVLQELAKTKRLVVVHLGNAYSLALTETLPSLVCAYENNEHTLALVPEVLFGALPASGHLPVAVGTSIPCGMGFVRPPLERLRLAEPEELGFDARKLSRIDSLANRIIGDHATPGCQVLVARNGAVVYNKAFGYQTYDSLAPVNTETLYDIASITKVAGTLQALMYLQERGRLRMWDKASDYLPDLKGTNKENMILAEILVHQAGLQPFIPYWKRTLKTVDLAETFYCESKDANWFNSEVVPGLYGMKTMEDTLWKWVKESDLLNRNKRGGFDYKYSDLGYYILKRIVENLVQEPLDAFLAKTVYQPLGLDRLCYQPKRRFPETEIAPTERDTLFRRTQVRGNVHDPGAAMLGGVAGHAGLFANAWSLAVLMQMNLNYGYYGGEYHLLPQTVPFFAQRHFPRNRRGLGWDKPYLWSKDGPTSQLASPETFGHTGFTGTCVWADPKNRLLFVFLSNRVYPDAENSKLIKQNIRPKLHDLVYQAMLEKPRQDSIAPPDTTGE